MELRPQSLASRVITSVLELHESGGPCAGAIGLLGRLESRCRAAGLSFLRLPRPRLRHPGDRRRPYDALVAQSLPVAFDDGSGRWEARGETRSLEALRLPMALVFDNRHAVLKARLVVA